MKYRGFEANGRLYHFCCISLGITNGVSVFQMAMDKMIEEEGLNDTFPYLNNITIAGKDQERDDSNIQGFLEDVQHRNLSLNQSKTVESVKSINILEYCACDSIIKPNTERLGPLQDYPPTTNRHSLH